MSNFFSTYAIFFQTALDKSLSPQYSASDLSSQIGSQVAVLASPGELAPAVEEGAQTKVSRIFVVGTTVEQMIAVQQLVLRRSTPELVAVALRGTTKTNSLLEKNGARFVVSNLEEVAALVTTAPIKSSLSVLLLAYNEEAVIEKAVNDVHGFCQLYAPDYEILIVDDGSTDATPQLVRALCGKNVQVITHATNRGMGVSMKDGYEAAQKDYVVSLPGDRQVKAHSLAAFLPFIAEGPKDTVVLSQYVVPHSGRGRAVMSAVFRLMLRYVGDLNVDVAGAYLFSKSLFNTAQISSKVASQTFLYSFQLLESFQKRGAQFAHVMVVPFPREVGQSREATVGRVVKMTKEIVKYRLQSMLYRLSE